MYLAIKEYKIGLIFIIRIVNTIRFINK